MKCRKVKNGVSNSNYEIFTLTHSHRFNSYSYCGYGYSWLFLHDTHENIETMGNYMHICMCIGQICNGISLVLLESGKVNNRP